jgi:hypothetical protein
VQPFDDVFVDVDLFAVMALFGGGTKLDDILPLYRWIRNGSIRLDVIDLRHAMPSDHEPLVRELAEWASGRTYAHQYLCGLSAAYIQLVLQNQGHVHGSGGVLGGRYGYGRYGYGLRSDAWSEDNSIVVECGTLNSKKVKIAMVDGQTIMVVPYKHGCRMSRKAQDRLAWPDYGDIDLAYMFTPLRGGLVDPDDVRMAEAINKLDGHGF